MDCYILQGKTVVPAADLDEWGQWFETTNRVVAQTRVANGVEVSTVFLGRDHAFGGGEPLLFETLIFGGKVNFALLVFMLYLCRLGEVVSSFFVSMRPRWPTSPRQRLDLPTGAHLFP